MAGAASLGSVSTCFTGNADFLSSKCGQKGAQSAVVARVGRTGSRRARSVRASAEEGGAAVSTVEVAGEGSARKPGPLERGGTLAGEKALGKDPSPATIGKTPSAVESAGTFDDPRWKDGTWDLAQFSAGGKVDWDAVIDAEVVRRQWLERNPESSSNDNPVLFDTGIVPWWAWVRRFHLPEAEKLNGRAAMIGYGMAYLVDEATGIGLVDQTSSFIGKTLILLTILGVLLIRRNEDVETIRQAIEEWTFYDRQWEATWKEGPPRPNSEKKVEELVQSQKIENP